MRYYLIGLPRTRRLARKYAAEHLGSPLIMVLGHERCGAVAAAVDAKGKAEGNIGAIVKTIVPAVKKASGGQSY